MSKKSASLIHYALLAIAIFSFLSFIYSFKISKKKVDVLFIGDSITYAMASNIDALQENFDGDLVIKGIPGMDTQDLHDILNRTNQCMQTLCFFYQEQLKLHKYKPEVIVLAIGSNNWARALPSEGYYQGDEYRAHRNYTEKTVDEIQADAALGTISSKGVKQIIGELKKLYGIDQKIMLVGGFPSTPLMHPESFNSHLRSLADTKEDSVYSHLTFLSAQALANMGWSDAEKRFFDDTNPVSEYLDPFETTHIDAIHLNDKGYEIYTVALRCRIKKMMNDLNSEECPEEISASYMNAEKKNYSGAAWD